MGMPVASTSTRSTSKSERKHICGTLAHWNDKRQDWLQILPHGFILQNISSHARYLPKVFILLLVSTAVSNGQDVFSTAGALVVVTVEGV